MSHVIIQIQTERKGQQLSNLKSEIKTSLKDGNMNALIILLQSFFFADQW